MHTSNINSDEERWALEQEWYSGRLMPYVEWVESFVREHRSEILQEAGGPEAGEEAVLEAVCTVIAREGGVHHSLELSEQVREMHNEIWYRGQHGDHDRKRIQAEWTAMYAEGWRRWRLKQYRYVVHRCSLRLLREIEGVS